MNILGFDTSATCCSTALLSNGAIVAEEHTWEPRSHASMLVPMIQSILRSAGVAVSELDGVAVSSGPGSYTGLRIGTSTAKGLCVASGASLIPVETTTAIAVAAVKHLNERTGEIAVLMHSRRSEVYAAAYAFPSMSPTLPVQPMAIGDIPTMVKGILAAAGNADEAIATHFPDATHVSLEPLGPTIARIGRNQLEQGNIADLATFEPQYLKPVATTRPKSIFQ